ncbi:probable mediator of RNA polymerase II transcription subunit 15c isoform X2 [Solanum pennellii]|uniref:Probable mediator of RNA polymerase II transcription subunit 15c isoform X2 n=1 Tax=Solanum pennellii TaxID=28526 RepID=A0ABM1V9S7_SOLPN|nr:probable mediator of RNA polymerase II transcription subunit 15c isoform X2 [Solanum pennellii]
MYRSSRGGRRGSCRRLYYSDNKCKWSQEMQMELIGRKRFTKSYKLCLARNIMCKHQIHMHANCLPWIQWVMYGMVLVVIVKVLIDGLKYGTKHDECLGYARSHLHGRAPLDSTVQTGNANEGDWQEKAYEKIKSMKEMHYSKLYSLYQEIADALEEKSQHLTNEQIGKLKMFKITLDRIMLFLQLNKDYITLAHKEKLLSVEKHINFFLRPRQTPKPTSSPVQEQLPQGRKQQTDAEPATKRAVPPSADAAATFLEKDVSATAASKAIVDHAIVNPPDVTASTVFDPASATSIP